MPAFRTSIDMEENESAPGTGLWVAVAPASDIGPGEMAGFEIQDNRVVIYNINNVYYATDGVCTHQFALLSDGWLDGAVVECPLHGGQFDVTTGKALGGIVVCDLKTYKVREAAGLIEVLLDG